VSSSGESEEEVEYVLIKRKKSGDPKKKAKKKEKEEKEQNKEKEKEKEKDKSSSAGGNKRFFKKGVFQDLKLAAQKDKEELEKEDENAPRKGKKKGKEGSEEQTEESKKDATVKDTKTSDQSEKKSKPKKEGEHKEETKEGETKRPFGRGKPAGDRPPRPYVPRDIAPPLSGGYEAPSIDDMLKAISTFYGTSAKEHFFSKLPKLAVFKILQFLLVRDIVALSRVNHFFNKMCRDDKLWKFLCERDFKKKLSEKDVGKKRFKAVYKDDYKTKKAEKTA